MARTARADLRRLRRSLDRLGRQVTTRIAPAVVRQGAEDLEREARMAAPVDAGELRESIRARPGVMSPRGESIQPAPRGTVAEVVTTDAEHAGHLEFGTRHMEPRPYMRPTYDVHGPRVRAQMERTAGRMIEREARP